MHILFITNNLPPAIDGVGDYTVNLARTFAAHGHRVTIVCRHREGVRTDYNGVTVLPIVNGWNASAGTQIAEVVRSHGVDVVSLQYVPHSFHPKGLPLGLVIAMRRVRKTGVKVMIFCHEVRVFGLPMSVRNILLEAATGFVSHMVLRQADVVATSIEYYAQLIRDLGTKKKVGIVPIASNIPLANLPHDERLSLRRKVADDDEIIVAFFGIRDTAKSVSAIEKLTAEGIRIKSLFIGKTPAGADTSRPVNAYRTGILEPEELAAYLSLPDVLVIPESSSFGCCFKSGSLAAAIQNGVAVLTGRGILTSPRLADGENVLFANFADVDDISAKLRSLCQNPDFRQKVGNAARSLATTWESTFESYITLLSSESNAH